MFKLRGLTDLEKFILIVVVVALGSVYAVEAF